MTDSVHDELCESSDVISRIDPSCVRAAADLLIEAFRRGNQAIFMGNGGSSADAQHIAAEFSGRYMMDRPALPGVCLSNIAPVTAIGNDYSYDLVFKRQVEAFCREGDVAVCYSTSGNSKNVVLAAEEAKARGAKVISFTGDCGKLREIADVAVVIPTKSTPRVQEGYLCASHIMCGIVESALFGSRAVFVDRDDTLAPNVPYCSDPSLFDLYGDVPEGVARLTAAGYKVIVVTNQSGIGRGYFDLGTLEAIHSKMVSQAESAGGRIDGIYFCPHRPDEGCGCRKPRIGMGLRAVRDHRVNPYSSFMVGDSDADMEFGRRLGCMVFRVGGGATFTDAVDFILGARRRRVLLPRVGFCQLINGLPSDVRRLWISQAATRRSFPPEPSKECPRRPSAVLGTGFPFWP